MDNDLPKVMTVPQVAAALGLGLRQTYGAIARGEIPSLRIGKRIMVSRQRLDDLINGAGPELRLQGVGR